LGAYRFPLETGLLIPSGKRCGFRGSPGSGTKEDGDGEVREIQRRRDNQRCNNSARSRGTYKSHYSGESELMRTTRKSLKELVDVTGIEPVTPCLQSIGLDSIRSIHY